MSTDGLNFTFQVSLCTLPVSEFVIEVFYWPAMLNSCLGATVDGEVLRLHMMW